MRSDSRSGTDPSYVDNNGLGRRILSTLDALFEMALVIKDGLFRFVSPYFVGCYQQLSAPVR